MRYLFLLLLPVAVFASSPEEGTKQKTTKYDKLSIRKKLKIANKLYEEGSYLNAAEYYEEVVKVKKDNVKILHFLAETFMGIRNYEKAEKYYAEVIKLDAAKYPSDQFNYGRALKANGKYEEAKSSFQKYIAAKRDKDDADFSRLAKTEILGCDSAVVWKANPSKVIVENETALNKALPDYSARSVKGGKVLYSSIKSDTAINVSTAKYD
jgi:tetratricopeptide (TPR) repeat protein